ncbi:MAG: ABC transporter permease, partial [Actinobacteria bacterium]|nr:ABC transporter permease [Actinomycetota bacterium]
IVTLGSLTAVRGLTLLYTNGRMIDGILGSPYTLISTGAFLGISNQIVIFFLIAAILGLLLHKTKFGRNVFCVGCNFEASRVVGINAERIKIITFIISAVLAAFSSILISSRLNTASTQTGTGFEFDAITAVVVGGTSLFGGKGSLPKTVLGVLFIACLTNAMVLLNLHFSFQYMVKAILLAIFVYLDIRSTNI